MSFGSLDANLIMYLVVISPIFKYWPFFTILRRFYVFLRVFLDESRLKEVIIGQMNNSMFFGSLDTNLMLYLVVTTPVFKYWPFLSVFNIF